MQSVKLSAEEVGLPAERPPERDPRATLIMASPGGPPRRPPAEGSLVVSPGHRPGHGPPARGTLLPDVSPFSVRPAGKVTLDPSLCIALNPDSAAAQQYRLLRYKLRESSDPRVVGVTSALQREGKTTVATNFALVLAEGQRARVMLLDLNLRGPEVCTMFGVEGTTPLPQQLLRRRQDPRAPWELIELGSRLHLLSGGEAHPNPGPLLNSEELRLLMDALVVEYDYVVVDLPSVLKAADVKSVEEMMDGLLLVVRAGATSRSAVSNSVRQLGEHRLLGVLMLDSTPKDED